MRFGPGDNQLESEIIVIQREEHSVSGFLRVLSPIRHFRLEVELQYLPVLAADFFEEDYDFLALGVRSEKVEPLLDVDQLSVWPAI